jgi:hypothetical protein
LLGRAALLGNALEVAIAMCGRDRHRFDQRRRAVRRPNCRPFMVTLDTAGAAERRLSV